jgi:hypothetical protein
MKAGTVNLKALGQQVGTDPPKVSSYPKSGHHATTSDLAFRPRGLDASGGVISAEREKIGNLLTDG